MYYKTFNSLKDEILDQNFYDEQARQNKKQQWMSVFFKGNLDV